MQDRRPVISPTTDALVEGDNGGQGMSDQVNDQPDAVEDAARSDLAKTESGSVEAADKLEREREKNPVGVEAVEQEESEAPQGRGLSR